jgi:hypothetical protein
LLVASIVAAAILAIRTHHDMDILTDCFWYSSNNGNDFMDRNNLETALHTLESYVRLNHSPLIEVTRILRYIIVKMDQTEYFPH